jgi:bacterioferritin-associated ferredoxin
MPSHSFIICNCNGVSQKEIEQFMTKHPQATFHDVQLGTAASTGCGRCALSVKKTMERVKAELPRQDQLTIEF